MEEIQEEYIKLEQFLKMNNLIDTGGQAKWFLYRHEVKVNGEAENRRGRKLRAGDTVTVDGRAYPVK